MTKGETMPETDVMSMWKEAEAYFVERMLATIEGDPQVLLETDGGPVGATADIVLALLYGFDEQVDAYWRLNGPVPWMLRRPIIRRLTAVQPDDDPTDATLRTADYRLQSSYARTTIADPRLLPPDVKLAPPMFECSVLLVRYRRRV